jgi:hypothetical protein
LNDFRTVNVYDFAGDKISRVRIFRDRAEAFEALGVSEQDARVAGI